jgi:hypothetical protein
MQRDGGLRQLFQKNLPEAHWQSVETWGTGVGVPDAEFCFHGGHQGWIEFKITDANKTSLTPEQAAWITRRVRYGGNVYIGVRRKRAAGARTPERDELWLFHGADARAILDGGITSVEPLGMWPGGPAKWDWAAILGILTT